MPRPVYTDVIGRGILLPGGSETIVLGAGYRWVIRDISGVIFCATGSGGTLGVDVGIAGLAQWSCPAQHNLTYHWEGRSAANAEDSVVVSFQAAASSAVASYAITGYALYLP